MKSCATEGNCKVQFHGMCAYLEGYHVELANSEEFKDDKSRNGMEFKFYCLEHSKCPEVKWKRPTNMLEK